MHSEIDSDADTVAAVRPASHGSAAGALGAVLAGALVAVALGAYAQVHEPRFFALNIAGFSSPAAVKSWLATVAVALGVFQLLSAMAMYRLLPRARTPSWLRSAHIWSGRLAVLASVPVAVHCLYALGFQTGDQRVLFHSLFGCFFYGAFVTKMVLLTRARLAAWVLPIAGGLLFFVLVYTWLTSALWFFQLKGLTI
ncbi:DUF6529 family protein [Mycolicibacterium mengxianglii]|uniref:DUF6529 family protein n=1 Tax=Mycolicibacterium mengxianglii TaxID=2736649 RepID=UPI0018EF0F2B|nr:DUF6529 family protein [Mycolicibacterium mengxianglii]